MSKRKHPSYTVHIVHERDGRKPQWFEVGALWEGANHALTGETVFGRMVLMPIPAEERTPRE